MCLRDRCAWLLTVALFALAAPARALANTSSNTVRTAPLSAQIRKDIVTTVARDFGDGPAEVPSGRTIALNSWVSYIPLGSHGPAAILVSSGPDDPNNGATGNGEYWLFRRDAGHATLILKAGGFGAVPRGHVYHHGMRDFQTTWNSSCCDGSLVVYRFNGTRYHPLFCARYTNYQDGHIRQGPRHPCNR